MPFCSVSNKNACFTESQKQSQRGREPKRERETERESQREHYRERQRQPERATERESHRELQRARFKRDFPRCPFSGVTLMSGETQPEIRCHSSKLSTTRREPSRFEEDLVLVF